MNMHGTALNNDVCQQTVFKFPLSRLRKEFKQLLEETGYVTPGKKLEEVRVLFMGRECWEALPELERQQIYDLHQQDLINRCKKNFQELLLEKADLFYQFRSSPAGTVTQDDILDITEGDIRDKIVLDLGMEHVPDTDHVCAIQKIL